MWHLIDLPEGYHTPARGQSQLTHAPVPPRAAPGLPCGRATPDRRDATQPQRARSIFQYHASLDEIIPIAQARALNQAWCPQGVRTAFTIDPGDHVAGQTTGLPAAIAWLSDRFTERPAPTTC